MKDNIKKANKKSAKKKKDVIETNTIEGFHELLLSYSRISKWRVERPDGFLDDPIAEKFTTTNNDGYKVMLQIIKYKKISVLELRWDLTDEDCEKMLRDIWNDKKNNHCAHCKTVVDLYRSGYITNIEKDRVRSDLAYFHPDQILCRSCTFCNQFFGNLSPIERNELIKQLKAIFMHKGQLNFKRKFAQLDIMRHEYENWAKNGGCTLTNNCSDEIQKYFDENELELSMRYQILSRNGKKKHVYQQIK